MMNISAAMKKKNNLYVKSAVRLLFFKTEPIKRSSNSIDAPEKMGPGVEDSVDSRKEPSVDHCDAQWIPAVAGMTKKDHSPRSHGFSQNVPRHSREGGNP